MSVYRRLACLGIALALAVVPAAAAAPPHQQAARIHYGEIVQGRLSENSPEQVWQFDGHAGDLIIIEMQAIDTGSLDTYLTLYDPQGDLLLDDDDGGLSVNSRIGPVALLDDGLYDVVASAYSGGGEYTLHIINLNTAPALKPGKPLVGQLDSGNPGDYFRVVPGDTVDELFRLSVNDDERYSAPVLSLYDMNGLVASTEETYSSELDPLILDSGATYAVVINWDPTTRGGPYELAFMPSSIALLNDGTPQTGELTYDMPQQAHYFQAENGQQVRLTLTTTSGEIAPAIDVHTIDYSFYLFSSMGETMRETSVVMAVPRGAIYMVEVWDDLDGGEGGSYTVTLDLLSE
jgi:hypothetical protein